MSLSLSWLDSANEPDGPFPLNNLPYGVFSLDQEPPRCGVAVGDRIFDLAAAEADGLLCLGDSALFAEARWNLFMAAGPDAWGRLRTRLTELLAENSPYQSRTERHLRLLTRARLHMPFRVAGYTDFYAGRHHAKNVATMLRGPEAELPAAWLHMPLAYIGRSASVVVSGTPIRRPWGQVRPKGAETPIFAPSRRFDFELEVGTVVGGSSTFGRPVSVAEADRMIFGHVLLNDWSARDIQGWESEPLGPFQGKATATTVSPWIVTAEALRPFRVPAPPRVVPILPYLAEPEPTGLAVVLEAALQPAGRRPTIISRTDARELYWTGPQQLAHHTSAGGPMETGDLLGSGTVSGPEPGSRGSLLELTWAGREPLTVDGGTRRFLEDGDSITLRGWAQGEGFRLGFGECEGTVLPALTDPYAG